MLFLPCYDFLYINDYPSCDWKVSWMQHVFSIMERLRLIVSWNSVLMWFSFIDVISDYFMLLMCVKYVFVVDVVDVVVVWSWWSIVGDNEHYGR